MLCASASSLRRASSSRSNLITVRDYQHEAHKRNLLPSEDLDVKPSSVPHAHTEYEQEVSARPERRVIEKKDGRDIGENRVNWIVMS